MADAVGEIGFVSHPRLGWGEPSRFLFHQPPTLQDSPRELASFRIFRLSAGWERPKLAVGEIGFVSPNLLRSLDSS